MMWSAVSAQSRGLLLTTALIAALPVAGGCGRVGFAGDANPHRDGGDSGVDSSVAPRAALCGDGVVSAPEDCDDRNGVDGDGCESDCTFSCSVAADCDDGAPCNGTEVCTVNRACEPGAPPTGGVSCAMGRVCRAGACALVSCGDSSLDAGEDCDDGNIVNDDGCDNDCTLSCAVDMDCDQDGDSCTRETCRMDNVCEMAAVVIDGAVCDRDGNAATVDVCLGGTCFRSVCGDGYLDAEIGEECDDGNLVDGDGCDADCTYSCGSDADCDDGEPCNGTEGCDALARICTRGRALADGTACMTSMDGGPGRCAAGACIGVMTMDSGAPDTGAPDTGTDAGTCPGTPSPDMPLHCFQVCTTTEECVLVQSSCCCPCSSGGSSEAINGLFMSQWTSRQAALCAPLDCRGVGCLSVFVCPGPPACVGGLCTAGGGGASL